MVWSAPELYIVKSQSHLYNNIKDNKNRVHGQVTGT